MKKELIVFGAIILLAGNFYGEEAPGGVEKAILDLGVGARPLGMGGAFVSLADDVNAVYWNPAGLSKMKGKEISSMYSQLFLGSKFYYLSYAQSIKEEKLGVGISWLMVTTAKERKTIVRTDADGVPLRDADGRYLYEEVGEFGYLGNVVLLGYGQRIGERMSLGATGKVIWENLDQEQGVGIGINGGIIYEFKENLSFGALLEDIGGTRVKWEKGEDNLPGRVKIGLSYGLRGGKEQSEQITFNLGLEQVLKKGYRACVRLGTEWQVHPNLFLRLGYDGREISAGLGIKVKVVLVDYAYVAHTDLANTHRLSVGVRF